MNDEGTVTINEKAAIKIGSEAWRDGIMLKSDIIISGFRSCGLYPLSYPAIQRRFKLFRDGEINKKLPSPVWI